MSAAAVQHSKAEPMASVPSPALVADDVALLPVVPLFDTGAVSGSLEVSGWSVGWSTGCSGVGSGQGKPWTIP
jgi:hypothetical protein